MISDNNIIKKLKELLEGEKNFITNCSNFTALINSEISDINWVGFYFIEDDSLLLGPFQGKPACIRLPKSKGVCWAAVEKGNTLIVDDVHDFPGHIACDPMSKSELVVPLRYNDAIFGVLDIDSPIKSRFNKNEADIFEEMTKILLQNSDLIPILKYYGFLH